MGGPARSLFPKRQTGRAKARKRARSSIGHKKPIATQTVRSRSKTHGEIKLGGKTLQVTFKRNSVGEIRTKSIKVDFGGGFANPAKSKLPAVMEALQRAGYIN